MANVEVNDLGKDGEEPKKETTLSEEDLKHVKGGAGYLKIGDIKGESNVSSRSFKVEIEGVAPTLENKTWKI